MKSENLASAFQRPDVGDSAVRLRLASMAVGLTLAALSGAGFAATADDQAFVAKLDAQYQKAVETNDVKTMAAILADDFIVVEGNGKRWTKADLLKSATDGQTRYDHQIDSERNVMVTGDTAIVTAKLWAKGSEDGAQVDYTEWFSDVYVRTPKGWRYYFGQASLPLPRQTGR